MEAALQAARPELKGRLGSAGASLPDHHQLDAFYQTVTAAGTQQCGVPKRPLIAVLCQHLCSLQSVFFMRRVLMADGCTL